MAKSNDIDANVIGGCAVIIIVLILIVVRIITWFTGVMPNYSDGERAGTVYKLSHKGLIWKSYEGELQISQFGMRNQNGQDAGNRWTFSVRDPLIAEQIDVSAASGHRVTLHYHQYFWKPGTQDSDYVVDQVEHGKD